MAGWRSFRRSCSDRRGTKGGALPVVATVMMPPLGSSRSVVCGAHGGRRPARPLMPPARRSTISRHKNVGRSKRGTKKKYRTPCRKHPPPSQFGENLPTYLQNKASSSQFSYFLATSTEIRPKIDIPKKNPQLNGNFDGFGKKTTLKKGPPSVHRTKIYLPTSGMGSCTFFLHPACTNSIIFTTNVGKIKMLKCLCR